MKIKRGEVKIRKAEIEDKEQILKLVKRLYSRSAPKNVEAWKKYYGKLKNQALIAEVNKKIIAYLAYIPYRDALYIADLYVTSKYRRKGIATKLIKTVEKIKKKLKKSYLKVNVRKKDLRARKFYIKLGFKNYKPKFKKSLKLKK